MTYYWCRKCQKTYVLPDNKHVDLKCSCGTVCPEVRFDGDRAEGGVFFDHGELPAETKAGVYGWMEAGFAVLDSRRSLLGELPKEEPKPKVVSWSTDDGSEGFTL